MKVNYGAVIVDGRGKLGGHVSQRNFYGNIFRTKTTPINRSTVRQQNRRVSLSELSKEWATLTDDQRIGWRNFAKTNPVTDIFGSAMKLTGFNMFCKVNLNFDTVGLPRSKSERKERRALRRMYKANLKAEGGTIIVDSTVPITEGIAVAVYTTAPISPGIASGGSQYKHIQILNHTDVFPVDLTTNYVKYFGAIVDIGEKIFIKLVQISDVSGLASPPITASAIIVFLIISILPPILTCSRILECIENFK